MPLMVSVLLYAAGTSFCMADVGILVAGVACLAGAVFYVAGVVSRLQARYSVWLAWGCVWQEVLL